VWDHMMYLSTRSACNACNDCNSTCAWVLCERSVLRHLVTLLEYAAYMFPVLSVCSFGLARHSIMTMVVLYVRVSLCMANNTSVGMMLMTPSKTFVSKHLILITHKQLPVHHVDLYLGDALLACMLQTCCYVLQDS